MIHKTLIFGWSYERLGNIFMSSKKKILKKHFDLIFLFILSTNNETKSLARQLLSLRRKK